MRSRSHLLVLALLLAGCGSSGVQGEDFGGPPTALSGFPPQSIEGIVYAQARYADHARELGVDLLSSDGIIPIKLKVLLRGSGQQEAQIYLNPERMNLRMYLPDGTILRSLSTDDVVSQVSREKVAQVIRDSAFRGDLLSTTGIEGYVFFRLRPRDEFEVDGRRLRHASRGVTHSMDLTDSLIAFDLSVETGGNLLQPFYVGIQR